VGIWRQSGYILGIQWNAFPFARERYTLLTVFKISFVFRCLACTTRGSFCFPIALAVTRLGVLVMSNRVKIFIVEYDCVSLITLMLWLDQFPDFEVLGTTIDTGNLGDQVAQLQPDVVLLDIATPGPEDIAPLLEIKSVEPSPAVLLLYHGDPTGLKGILQDESDGQLGPNRTLGDLQGAILRAYNKRRLAERELVALAG
jgi:hypothetical protein